MAALNLYMFEFINGSIFMGRKNSEDADALQIDRPLRLQPVQQGNSMGLNLIPAVPFISKDIQSCQQIWFRKSSMNWFAPIENVLDASGVKTWEDNYRQATSGIVLAGM